MFLRHSSISSVLRHYTAKPRRRLTHAQSSSWLGAAGLEVRRGPRDAALVQYIYTFNECVGALVVGVWAEASGVGLAEVVVGTSWWEAISEKATHHRAVGV